MRFASKFSESKKNTINAFRFCTLVLSIFTSPIFSQTGTWVSIYGGTNYDQGRGITQTFDNGYVICGPTSSYGAGNTDFYLLKIDSVGKYKWQNTFGGATIENAFSVQQTSDSGFVICGYSNSFSTGGYNAYLVKTDDTGNLQWENNYGGSDWDLAYWAESTNDGGYILTGETFSYGNNKQAYLVKVNSKGDKVWEKSFGGINEEATYEVHQTLDNGYILAGYTNSFGAGQTDFYLIKTNSDGDTLWTKTYGGTNNDSCSSIGTCSDGGFLLGGSTVVGTTQKMHFLKTDSAGNIIDSNAVASPGSNYISRIRETNDKKYITLTNSDAGILLHKWNIGGGFGSWTMWGKSFGTANDLSGYDLQQTADSGFVLVGFTASLGIGPDNIYIAKTDSLGSYNSTTNSYVAVNEISESNDNTLIYPNPFSEILYLNIDKETFPTEKNLLFEIFDLCGRPILNINLEMNFATSAPIQITLNPNDFTKGFYIAKVSTKNKQIHRKLLFVK